jgi:hypothetical protein
VDGRVEEPLRRRRRGLELGEVVDGEGLRGEGQPNLTQFHPRTPRSLAGLCAALVLFPLGCAKPKQLSYNYPPELEHVWLADHYRCQRESTQTFAAGGGSWGAFLLLYGWAQWRAQREADRLYELCMKVAGWESDEAREARAMQYFADLDACKEQADGAADFATAMNACLTARGHAPADAFGIAALRCMPKMIPLLEGEKELPPDFLGPGLANCLEAHGAITRPMADDWIACYAEHGLDPSDLSALDHSDLAACVRARGNWQ